MKHTPTPWVLKHNGLIPSYIGTEFLNIALICESGFGQSVQNRTDAEFILKAVNSHDELVEALRTMYGYFNDITIHDDENKSDTVLKKARAILAKIAASE